MVLSLASLLLVTRVIGPTHYGVFVAAAGIQAYLVNLGQLGLNVYLIRSETAPTPREYNVAATLTLSIGVSLALLVWLLLPLLERWLRLPHFGAVMPMLLAALPLQLLGLIPTAHMERGLNYQRVAAAELAAQAVNMLVAIPLAWKGYGATAPAVALLVSQTVGLLLLLKFGGQRLTLAWDGAIARRMLGYGLGYASSLWVWQLRQLVNPVLVARFAGAEAVGIIALALRFVDLLSFVKTATYRVAMSALAKMQGDATRVRNAITEGAGLQVLTVGPLFVGFAVLAPLLLPKFFGTAWEASMTVFPFIALGVLVNAVFNLHSSVLYVYRRNAAVAAFHAANVTLLVGAALVLVPRYGAIGYGWAEVVALASYAVIHATVARQIGSPNYRRAALWGLPCAFALFTHSLGMIALLPLLAVALLPYTHRTLGQYTKHLRHQHG